MFFQSSFFPAGAYPCAGCDAIMYNPNPVTLSHNQGLMCSSCLHGPSAFPYIAQPTTYSLSNTVVNSANLACHHQQVLNPFSQPIYNASSSNVHNHLPFPNNFHTENRVIGKNDSIQVTNEIDSWLVLEPGREGNAKINGPPCMEANNNLDTSSYWPYTDQIEYKYLCDHLWEAFQPTENVVSVQALADQAHNFNMGLEQEALGASTLQTPSSMLAASSFQCTDAQVVAEATNRCSINQDYMTGEGASGSSSRTRTAPIIPPKYSPWFRKMRVLRYKHKKKQRKFGGPVRYSSRRANAETRRRVRGRFVRNT